MEVLDEEQVGVQAGLEYQQERVAIAADGKCGRVCFHLPVDIRDDGFRRSIGEIYPHQPRRPLPQVLSGFHKEDARLSQPPSARTDSV